MMTWLLYHQLFSFSNVIPKARINFKLSKSKSLVLKKGKVVDKFCFKIFVIIIGVPVDKKDI